MMFTEQMKMIARTMNRLNGREAKGLITKVNAGSGFSEQVCDLCSQICDACAVQCEKHMHFGNCKKCSVATREGAYEFI